MNVCTPEWLNRHGGELRPRFAGQSWAVCISNEPQYLVALVPMMGKHGCRITQTNNGNRFDSTASFGTSEEALQNGLEELRKALGW